MTAHFVMLWDDMLYSTINEHSPAVWKLWTVCLLRCDQDGRFRATIESLSRLANMTEEETAEAMEILTSPDVRSTSPDEEGRRILPEGPNQWSVVNYPAYRKRAQAERRKAEARERMRRVRSGGEQDGTDANECEQVRTDENKSAPYTSTSTSTSTSNIDKKKKKKKRSVFKPPSFEDVMFYIEEKGLEVIPHIFIDFYESKGWMVGKSRMKDWRAACRRSQDWDQMQAAWAKKGKTGSQHVGAPPTNGEWLYETYRKDDLNNHGNHSMWEQYASEASDMPPKSAPPFDEWLLENMTPEG